MCTRLFSRQIEICFRLEASTLTTRVGRRIKIQIMHHVMLIYMKHSSHQACSLIFLKVFRDLLMFKEETEHFSVSLLIQSANQAIWKYVILMFDILLIVSEERRQLDILYTFPPLFITI